MERTLTSAQTKPEGPSIELDAVSHTFSSGGEDLLVLQDISLRIEASEFVSIVGPSGCGKSTLLMLVAGLARPSEGGIRIAGSPVTGPDRGLGLMFQSDLLLDWRTVRENILLQGDIRMLDRKFADERVQELLKVAHLDGFEDRHPWELSGGMRQRVAICRTLLHDPRILLMDEPFGALDALTRDKMGRFLEDIRDVRGVNSQTVIFITHSIPEAVFLGDRVVVMTSRPGRIADIIDIKLPRPRRSSVRESAEFSQYLRRIRGYFEEEGE